LYYNPDERKKLLQILNKKGEVRDYEIRLKTKNGEIKYTSINARLILNSEGIADHIDGALRDISERKLAEESLKQSEERLRDIIFTTADWVWETDENGVYTYSSLKGIELFDIGEQDILGKTPFDFMPEDEAKRVGAIFSKIAAKKAPIKDLENWNIGKGGELICLLTNGVPIFDNEGQFKGYRGIDKDITERKKAEQELVIAKERAEASDRLKTAFMNNISHEIRTPLNGIMGFGQILADPEFPADEKESYFKMLEESNERLLNTITNIMDISLLTSGNQKINKAEFNIDQLIHGIYEKFEYSCMQKNLVFSIQKVHAENGTRIYTDESLLNKILTQLIDNSIKFTSSGTIEISYEIKDDVLFISVKDSGIGISEKHKSQIFDNFMQEDFDNNRRYEGTGIGLSIVKGLTEILGGSISFESEKGKGSSFSLSIPIN
jgi:PAS domain S-box-containing protein